MRSNLAFLPLIGSILWFRWPLDNPLEWRCVCPWSVPLFWFWLAPDLQIGIQRSCPWLVLIKTAPDSPWISIEIIQIFGLSIFELNRTERLLFFVVCIQQLDCIRPIKPRPRAIRLITATVITIIIIHFFVMYYYCCYYRNIFLYLFLSIIILLFHLGSGVIQLRFPRFSAPSYVTPTWQVIVN